MSLSLWGHPAPDPTCRFMCRGVLAICLYILFSAFCVTICAAGVADLSTAGKSVLDIGFLQPGNPFYRSQVYTVYANYSRVVLFSRTTRWSWLYELLSKIVHDLSDKFVRSSPSVALHAGKPVCSSADTRMVDSLSRDDTLTDKGQRAAWQLPRADAVHVAFEAACNPYVFTLFKNVTAPSMSVYRISFSDPIALYKSMSPEFSAVHNFRARCVPTSLTLHAIRLHNFATNHGVVSMLLSHSSVDQRTVESGVQPCWLFADVRSIDTRPPRLSGGSFLGTDTSSITRDVHSAANATELLGVQGTDGTSIKRSSYATVFLLLLLVAIRTLPRYYLRKKGQITSRSYRYRPRSGFVRETRDGEQSQESLKRQTDAIIARMKAEDRSIGVGS